MKSPRSPARTILTSGPLGRGGSVSSAASLSIRHTLRQMMSRRTPMTSWSMRDVSLSSNRALLCLLTVLLVSLGLEARVVLALRGNN
jgi:hypothetical protein